VTGVRGKILPVVLPGALFFLVLWLNNVALRAGGMWPQDAAFWLFVYVASVVVVAIVLGLRAQREARARGTVITTVVAAVAWFFIGGFFPSPGAEREVTVGDRGPRPGGEFTHSVGSQYKKPQVEATLAALSRLSPRREFDQFTCGGSAPEIRFALTLEPAEEYRERIVDVAYVPHVDYVTDRCLAFGLSFLVDSVFAGIDTGPRVDYGYVNPRTGARLPPYKFEVRKPICRCDLRGTGREWVAWSPQAAAALK
jgi:hypothetical protein